MRASICSVVAWATSGPPQRERRREWMVAWVSPERRDQVETRCWSSLRFAARSLCAGIPAFSSRIFWAARLFFCAAT